MKKSLRRTKWAGAVLGAVLLVAMLVGCNGLARFFGFGEEPGDSGDGKGQNNPYDLSRSFFVHSDGNDGNDGSQTTPFATLAAAYDAALDDPVRNTIVVLSNLDLDASAAMELNAHDGTPQEITITSAGAVADGPWTLARSDGSGEAVEDAVVQVTGGAQVVFNNITIDGKNNTSKGSVRNRALYIEGAATKVTLDHAHLVGLVTEPDSVGGAAVYVRSGELIMNDGSTITGETVDYGSSGVAFYGGGVYLESNGTFTMNGGIVKGEAIYGGGVFSYGTFTMNDGEISDSTSSLWSFPVGSYGGAGVFVAGGTFTMIDGEIKNNTCYNNYSGGGGGGGVHVTMGQFFMQGGAISENEVIGTGGGGGVYVESNGSFEMSGNSIISGNEIINSSDGQGGGVYNKGQFFMKGGTISDNTVSGNGGGVFVESGGTFIMSGSSTISKNTAVGNGGGVYNNNTFTMEDGTISGNHADGVGGGVFTSGIFMMNSGVIYGRDGDAPPADWMKNSDGDSGSACADSYVQATCDGTIYKYPPVD